MIATLKIVHFLALAVGLGGGVANAVMAAMGGKAREVVGPMQARIGQLGFGAVVLLWLTGLWLFASGQTLGTVGLMFWLKILAVLVLTAAAVANQLARRRLPPEQYAARAPVLGQIMGISATLAVIFAVLAFG